MLQNLSYDFSAHCNFNSSVQYLFVALFVNDIYWNLVNGLESNSVAEGKLYLISNFDKSVNQLLEDQSFMANCLDVMSSKVLLFLLVRQPNNEI